MRRCSHAGVVVVAVATVAIAIILIAVTLFVSPAVALARDVEFSLAGLQWLLTPQGLKLARAGAAA